MSARCSERATVIPTLQRHEDGGRRCIATGKGMIGKARKSGDDVRDGKEASKGKVSAAADGCDAWKGDG